MRWIVTTLALLLVGTTGLALAFVRHRIDRDALVGVMLEGHRYHPKAHGTSHDFVRLREQQVGEETFLLMTPGETVTISYAHLGIGLDTEGLLHELRALARAGGVLERAKRAWLASQGRLEIPLRFTFDREKASRALKPLATTLKREPVNARLDLENHYRVESEKGHEFDLRATLDVIAEAIDSGGMQASAQLILVEPAVSSDSLLDVDVSKVLASYDTSFKGKAGPRAVNIKQAAVYLSGTVLPPGAEFSFNKTVGRRERERGFVDAPVIINDVLEDGVGGGVCQVASTLHAAAVFGGLDITRRRSHSRPSGYAPLGLDATVIDDEVDLRFRNTYDTPLIIHAFLPEKYTLRVELLGRKAPGKIEHFYTVRTRHDFLRRIIPKAYLSPGDVKKKQKGNYGFDVLSTVRLVYPDGKRTVHHYSSKYYPVPEIFWVAEGTDPAMLPELPEGANEVEYLDESGIQESSLSVTADGLALND